MPHCPHKDTCVLRENALAMPLFHLPFRNTHDAYNQFIMYGWKTTFKELDILHHKDVLNIETGRVSNLIVFIVDMSVAEKWKEIMKDTTTFTVKADQTTMHFYFLFDRVNEDDLMFRTRHADSGITIYSEGGQITAPTADCIVNNIEPQYMSTSLIEFIETTLFRIVQDETNKRKRCTMQRDTGFIDLDLAKLVKAQECIRSLQRVKDENRNMWENEIVLTKIIWACATLCKGNPLLLKDLVDLCKTSQTFTDVWIRETWASTDLNSRDSFGLKTLIKISTECSGQSLDKTEKVLSQPLLAGSPYEHALSSLLVDTCKGFTDADKPFYIKGPKDGDETSLMTLEPSSKRLCPISTTPIRLEVSKNGNVQETCEDPDCAKHPQYATNLSVHMLNFINVGFNITVFNERNEDSLLPSAIVPEHKMKYYNERYAIVKIGGKTRVIDRSTPDWECSAYDDFIKMYSYDMSMVVVDKRPIKAIWAKLWFDHPSAKRYNRMRFNPGGPEVLPGLTLNLWTGFSVEPTEKGDCDLYLKLLKEAICDGDQVLYDYVLNWFAYSVQRPECVTETALVFQGPQGCGKGTIVDVFGKLFGEAFTHVIQSSHFTGKFNAQMERCKILFVDEATFGGDRREAGIIKGYITEKTVRIERKGIDHYRADSFINLIISSNNDWAVPVEKDDRRFICVKPNAKFKGNFEFFKSIRTIMDKGGSAKLLHMLKTRDITAFDPKTMPKSKAMEKQKLAVKIESLDPVPMFIHSMLSNQSLPTDEILSSDLYERFMKEMRPIRDVRGISITKFSTTINEILGDGIKLIHKRNGNHKRFDEDKCKAKFALWIGSDVKLMFERVI
jgi:hypothetical protein